jgi:hypothetical protein
MIPLVNKLIRKNYDYNEKINKSMRKLTIAKKSMHLNGEQTSKETNCNSAKPT